MEQIDKGHGVILVDYTLNARHVADQRPIGLFLNLLYERLSLIAIRITCLKQRSFGNATTRTPLGSRLLRHKVRSRSYQLPN